MKKNHFFRNHIKMIKSDFYQFYSTTDLVVPVKRGIDDMGHWEGLERENRFQNINFTRQAPNHSDFHKDKRQTSDSYAPKVGVPTFKFATLYSDKEISFQKDYLAIMEKYFKN